MKRGSSFASLRRTLPLLATAWLLFFLTAGATYAVPPVLLKPIMDEIGASQAQVSLFPAVFLLSKGVCALPAGELLHRCGARRCILWGVLSLVLATAAYSCAEEYWHFLALHAIFGICYSFGGLGAYLCLCNEACPDHVKSTAIGLTITAFSMAGVLWPPMCAALVEARGWRFAYAVCPVSLMVVGVPLAFLLQRLSLDRRVGLDADTRALTRVTEATAEAPSDGTSAQQHGGIDLAAVSSPATTAEQLAPGTAAAAAAAVDSSRSRARATTLGSTLAECMAEWRRAWWVRERGVWHLLAMSVEVLYIVNALLQLLVLYLSADRGMPLQQCAAYQSAIFGCSVAGKVVCGLGLDGRHSRRVALGGCALLLCGTVLSLSLERPSADGSGGGGGGGAWQLAPVSGSSQLLAFSVVYGLGYGASFSLVQSRAARHYGHREGFGRLQGALVCAQYVGSFLGITVTALLREMTGSYLAPFSLFPALAALVCLHCRSMERVVSVT